ncbi:hypothetical protein [Streptomyces sp. DSM 40907]|uniref:hypothetical protein n=1 Tax=Streptomyces kutzneri TaxID=3051179 RepID=UPI0028D3B785|nr:hypothetical protein [Streptomyces sp. DSM 40907]
MSRPRHVWSLLGVVLAVLLGCAAPAMALAPARTAPAPAADSTPHATPYATPAPAPVQPHAAVLTDGDGPACAPETPGHGGTPAVPTRAAGEQHAQVPPVRPVPEEAGPAAAMPVRNPVRGPGRPAPDPVELCVMRV